MRPCLSIHVCLGRQSAAAAAAVMPLPQPGRAPPPSINIWEKKKKRKNRYVQKYRQTVWGICGVIPEEEEQEEEGYGGKD